MNLRMILNIIENRHENNKLAHHMTLTVMIKASYQQNKIRHEGVLAFVRSIPMGRKKMKPIHNNNNFHQIN